MTADVHEKHGSHEQAVYRLLLLRPLGLATAPPEESSSAGKAVVEIPVAVETALPARNGHCRFLFQSTGAALPWAWLVHLKGTPLHDDHGCRWCRQAQVPPPPLEGLQRPVTGKQTSQRYW